MFYPARHTRPADEPEPAQRSQSRVSNGRPYDGGQRPAARHVADSPHAAQEGSLPSQRIIGLRPKDGNSASEATDLNLQSMINVSIVDFYVAYEEKD